MASIKLTGDTSGVITVSAPAAAGTNTLTLPATTGTILDTNSALVSSKLTGALPAIDGSALTGISSGGKTLLGTLTTTSGTSHALTSQNLSSFNTLQLVFAQVSHSDGSGKQMTIKIGSGAVQTISSDETSATNSIRGTYNLDLLTNIETLIWSTDQAPITSGNSNTGSGVRAGVYDAATNLQSLTSTTITVAWTTGSTFDNGKVKIYGLKQEKIMATTINGSTGASQVQDNTVSNAKVVDDAIGVAELSATGTASSSTFLRGDNAWAAPGGGGLTLLKTVPTSSGTTVVAADLDLSTYKTLIVEFWSCSPDTTEDTSIRWANTGGTAQKLGVNGTNASQGYYGRVTHDLVNKYVWTNVFNRDQTDLDGTLFMSGAEVSLGVNNQITTSTTSITFDWYSGQDFDGGIIYIYGLK